MDAKGCWGLKVMFVILFAAKMDAFPMIGITIVQDAVAKGAVCLDGTPPAYHLDRGFGSGENSWLVQVEGGAWCNNITSCFARKSTPYGSSTYMAPELPFSGILSNNGSYNPDFYNWNRVKVRYCDGASFTGDVEEVDPSYNLYYRGARIFAAIIEDLLAKGMNRAEHALLSGCSAGGLTSILHCDEFRSLLPASAQVKCLADAGYFINVLDIIGTKRIETFYSEVVSLHGSEKNLPSSCTSRITPSSCFFPQYVVDQIQTPIFILNAAYDAWQIQNSLVPGVAVPHGTWYICKANINNCSQAQLGTLQEFRQNFLSAIERVRSDTGSGMFINSCYAHCQSELQETWLGSDSPKLDNTTISKAVGDWYYGRNQFTKIDCPFPCDSTCHNLVW